VYCDGSLKVRGFPHECQHDKTKTVVVKTHEAKHFKMFTKIVLLLRNPYDALLSYANFLKAGHTGHPSEKVLIKGNIHQYVFEQGYILEINFHGVTCELYKGWTHGSSTRKKF
jgi:hypothetical protein